MMRPTIGAAVLPAVLVAVLVTLTLTAAGAERDNPAASPSAPATAPDDESPAARGYRLLTTRAYLGAEFGDDYFEQLWTVWPEPLRSEAEAASPDERRRLAYARYGLIEAPEADRDLPLAFVRNAQGHWALTCLACHGGQVAGRPIAGLGNSHFAFQTLTEDAVRREIAQGRAVSQDLLGRLYAPLGRSNGTTNAQIFSVALVAMRDDELNFVPLERLPNFDHHDLDAPPLWNTKRKSRLYIDGFVEKSSRVLMQFALVPSNDAATLKSWDGDFEDILAWIESLEPPAWPWEIDRPLADAGRAIFNRACADCHGTYGPDGSYPERMVAIDEVGTDPARLVGMPREHREFFARGWMGQYGAQEVIAEPEGYVAPPLDGIWASAPYLHNGSVPTLHHLFYADERPAVWRRTADGYDQQRVGLEVVAFDELPEGIRRGDQRREFFDTRLRGKSAAGHLFPEALSDDEKRAVIEYLKTL